MNFPGPAALGRGLIVSPNSDIPIPFASAPTVVINDAVLAAPKKVADQLHEHWLARRAVVVVLAVDPALLRKPELDMTEPWQLDPTFEFSRERLQFLVWANNYDGREGEPVWWWTKKAVRLFPERIVENDVADVVVDGNPVWCDGGPRQSISADLLDGHRLLHRDEIEIGLRGPIVEPPTPIALAPDQESAVLHDVGPARIIAPAGSGKTRVLTERVRHLLTARNWDSRSTMVLAYNKRAADEMVERTAGLNANVRTLNSLGLAICNGTNGFASPQGRPRRQVIDEMQVRSMVDQRVDVRRMANTDPYAPFLEGLRMIRLALIDPEEAEVALEAPGLAKLFPNIVEAMEEQGLIDFDGQLYEAIRILLTDPVARARAQLLSRHLLVDEFQDLTPAHLLLIRLLSAPSYDVFGVGDDDQVIYGFAGATPDYLINFDQYFPGAAHYNLGINYRCTPPVVQAASNLLTHNFRRVAKTISPRPGLEARPDDLQTIALPAVGCAPDALDRLREFYDGGTHWSDMAVLCRVNATLLPVQVLLTQAGVPCRAPLTESILERTGIRAAFSYLRIAISPDSISRRDIQETIRRPSRRIAGNVSDMLTKQSKTNVAAMKRVANYLTGDDSSRVASYVSDIELLQTMASSKTTAEILRTIRVEIGLGDAMEKLDRSRREADRSTHNDDLIALEQVAALHEDPGSFEKWLRGALKNKGSDNGVELSTIHRVKGREWPKVIVYGVDEGLLPHRLSTDLSEERRLLHVALTRASDECVVLTDAANPSLFLDEMTKVGNPKAPEKVAALSKAEPAVKAPVIDLNDEEQKVYDALAKWRTEAAKAASMPAYIILSNADLRGVSKASPSKANELARCKGMGPVKMERYGEDILRVIASACESTV